MKIKDEIIADFKQISSHQWSLAEPHLLYLEDNQVASYLKTMENKSYSGGFHSEMVEILSNNIPKVFKGVSEINLVDLGPGYPDKSLLIGKGYKNKGILNYYPVDISKKYLEITEKEMEPYCSKVVPVHLKFDDLPGSMEYPRGPKTFVIIGLTFMNFDGDYILKLLRQISNGEGKVIIASELLSKGTNEILSQYQVPEAKTFAFGPLNILGFSIHYFKFSINFDGRKIELLFSPTTKLRIGSKDMDVGDQITTAVSYRYRSLL